MQRDLQFLLDMLQSAELIMIYTDQCVSVKKMRFSIIYSFKML